jgi:hypothetical protein
MSLHVATRAVVRTIVLTALVLSAFLGPHLIAGLITN